MKKRVLVVDDEKSICEVIRLQLEDEGYEVECAYDGKEAFSKIPQFSPDVVVTDVLMPLMTGIELCQTIKQTPEYRFLPVIVMTSLTDREKRLQALEVGADEFLNKPVDCMEMLIRLRALVKLKSLIYELEDTKNIIRMLMYIIEAKDGYTEKHSERVVEFSVELAKKCGLPEETVKTVEMGALVHDIGKIGIPENILLKPGKLTEDEFDVIKQHPLIGVDICKPLLFLKNVLKIIRHHHERIDGKGYPDGLKGDEIPIEARIVAIADAYDAMTSDRPYRNRFPKDKVLKVLKEGSGSQWDLGLIEQFLDLIKQIDD